MAAVRRKVVTYGKRANKGHDLFSQLQPTDDAPTLQSISEVRAVKLDPSPKMFDDRTDTTMFDLPASDEEAQLSETHRKKRKLTPVSKDKTAIREVHSGRVQKSTASKSDSRTGDLNRAKGPRLVDSAGNQSTKSAPGVYNKSSGAKGKLQTKKVPAMRMALRSPSISPSTDNPSRSPSQHPLTPPKRKAAVAESMTFTVSSSASIPTPTETPRHAKQLHNLLDDKGIPDSPSRLGLARLQLKSANASPEDSSSDPEHEHPEIVTKTLGKKQPPARTRLIDSLGPMQASPGDADANNEEDYDEDEADDEFSAENKIRTKPEMSIKQTNTSHQLPASGPKRTYGTQRSYLSDVVAELQPLDAAGSSQKSNLSFNTQADDFDFPDMDEDGGSGGIRSIHELRKAGEAARFQESLDSIFEDIASTSRSRKIIGYTQLNHKLQDSSFRAQFISSAMDRRLEKVIGTGNKKAMPGTDENILELTLHCTVTAWLLSDSQVTSRTMQSLATLMIPKLLPLLLEERTIDAITSDRAQNLSKATRKDIIAFQREVLQSGLWEGLQRPTTLTPRLVALRLIETTVLRTKELNASSLELPLPMLEHMVDLLVRNTTAGGLSPTDICLVELIVSILESYTVKMRSYDKSHLQALSRLADLGPLLQLLSSSDNSRYKQVQHLVLRLVLNITNSNTLLCDTFAQAPLIGAIMKIILMDFIHLTPTGATKADETDAVILSLGTAINFAEMSAKARRIIAGSSEDTPGTYLDRLGSLFLANLETASSTIGEGQDLVAFGYLAVLLCTMCIDKASLRALQAQFPRGDVKPLRQALQDFLKHFKKVEEEVDVEYHDFTARFERILEKMDQVASQVKP